MTKLEEKLKELGYEINRAEDDDYDGSDFTAEKKIVPSIYIVIVVKKNKIINYFTYDQYQIYKNKERLEKLELALNTMEHDLEVLKKYDNEL